ncbi:glycosyltransferase [Methylobacterium durans]|uniref:glycosyltransferase n=1 Tax=Methylobacterium durans TaxID=2202825 RepID=UPI002AFEAC0B|nr:glycosyltransferase [Methylobacterium durans]MEA1834434.1 glycosyltransferase [Methylobacterium durans]
MKSEPARPVTDLDSPGAKRRSLHVITSLATGGAERALIRRVALGDRADAVRSMHACDVSALSSRAEALPNCVGDAMAAGVPVVANEVGDAAEILGRTGWMVPREDPVTLVDAMLAAGLPTDRGGRGEAARARIFDHYNLDRVVSAYGALYEASIPN